MLEIKYSNHSLKFLKNCDKNLAKRLLKRTEKLQTEPYPQNMKRVEGQKMFRIRVGDYRILYEVDYINNILGIIKIDKREKVYD